MEFPEGTQLVEGIPYNPDGTPLTKQDMEQGGVTQLEQASVVRARKRL